MTLTECIVHCAGVPELVREFNRLSGFSLGEGAPIDRMIDEATGRDKAAMRAFSAFVATCVWAPLAAEHPGTDHDVKDRSCNSKEGRGSNSGSGTA